MSDVPACWGWPTPDDVTSWEPDYSTCDGSLESALRELHSNTPGVREAELLTWWQGDRCGVCGVRGATVGGLVTDHDHMTGLVRGDLCRSCNVLEGLRRGPSNIIWERYRKIHPTRILGITLRYIDPYTGEYVEPQQIDAETYEDRVRTSPLRGIGL